MTRTRSGTHEDLGREHEVAGSSDRTFGVVFAVVCGVVSSYGLWLSRSYWVWWAAACAVFLLLATVRPRALAPLNRVWFRIGSMLHHIVNPVVMGVMFLLVFTPIGIAMRATGKDFLRLRLDRNAKTYWIERDPPGPASNSMKNQF